MSTSDSLGYSTAAIPEHLLLSAIIDSSDDAIISKNLDGIITSWNVAAQRIFGYTASEMIGKPISLLFPLDRLGEEPAILERIRRGERVDHFETIRLNKSGVPLDISVTISPVKDETGRIVGASKIARDITEQKRYQREMAKLNEELQRANRLNSEFFAVMSHELRTPLNAIAGWVQILRDKDADPDQLQHGLAIIERNTWAQVEMINDLLDMSRIVTGKLKLDLVRVDLASLVGAAIEAQRPAADAKGLRLSSALTTVGGCIMADPARLQQVIGNLLSNAIKFTPKGGRIHVAIERVNSHVEIVVTDNGKGIKSEFLGFVFDRFRQEDSSTTRSHGGLGLGLAIVKQLIEMHGGHVRVKSQGEGQGATFTVGLPIIASHIEEQQFSSSLSTKAEDEEDIPAADLTGVKVLVVDDEADSREVIRRILESRHASVETARSMGEAIAKFAAHPADVVLTDIGMPEQSGYDLLRRLRTLKGGEKTPVIAVTALARSEDRSRALRAGFQMHVTKPVHADELTAIVLNLSKLKSS